MHPEATMMAPSQNKQVRIIKRGKLKGEKQERTTKTWAHREEGGGFPGARGGEGNGQTLQDSFKKVDDPVLGGTQAKRNGTGDKKKGQKRGGATTGSKALFIGGLQSERGTKKDRRTSRSQKKKKHPL